MMIANEEADPTIRYEARDEIGQIL